MNSREERMRQAIFLFADTVVNDVNLAAYVDSLTRILVDSLDVTACAISLAGPEGSLTLVAASPNRPKVRHLGELLNDNGHRFHSESPADAVHLNTTSRWRSVTRTALVAGFAGVHVLPLRSRDRTLGAVTLLCVRPGELAPETAALGRALADMASIGILTARHVHHDGTPTDNLDSDHHGNITIEQATGMVSECLNMLNTYSRRHDLRLANLAETVMRDQTRTAPCSHTLPRQRGPAD